jgi:hypothetical protein
MSSPTGSFDTIDSFAASVGSDAPLASAAPAPFQSQTEEPLIGFAATGAPSVSMPGFYITPDDSIQMSVWNSAAALTSVSFQLRVLKPNGTIVIEEHTINNVTSDRTQNSILFQQLEGFLVGAVVGPSGVALSRGQTFVQVAVIRGSPQSPLMTMVLVADYLTSAYQPSWPFGQPGSATDGAGFIYQPVGGQPPVGGNASIVQPAGTRWKIHSIMSQLQTSAAVGNRQFQFRILTGSPFGWISTAAATQAASLTYNYQIAPGTNLDATVPQTQTMPLPTDLILRGGVTLETTAIGLQAGDQFTPVGVLVEEWLDV